MKREQDIGLGDIERHFPTVSGRSSPKDATVHAVHTNAVRSPWRRCDILYIFGIGHFFVGTAGHHHRLTGMRDRCSAATQQEAILTRMWRLLILFPGGRL